MTKMLTTVRPELSGKSTLLHFCSCTTQNHAYVSFHSDIGLRTIRGTCLMENFQEICCSVKLWAVIRPQSHQFCFAHEVLDRHDSVIKILGSLGVEAPQADCIIF